MSTTIEFFFDIGSPYSYLAATQIDEIGERAGAAVEWKPFLLGGVFKACGNTMPAAVNAKAAWMFEDLNLWADEYGVEFQMSSHFPANSLTAQRALIAAGRVDESKVPGYALALYQAYWVDDVDVSKPEAVARAADEAGLSGGSIVEMCSEQDVKDELRAVTEDAVARGAFGAPTVFVGEQMFWGNDRLHFVEKAARGAL